MKKVFQKSDSSAFTERDYLDGRTLLSIHIIEAEDKKYIKFPHEAKYELRFHLCADKYLPFFLDEKGFHDTIAYDDVDRITMKSALEAEKRTVEKIMDKYDVSDQQRIAGYMHRLEQTVKEDAETAQRMFGGEGK